MLSPLPHHLDTPGSVRYLYEGRCPVSGQMLQLPRTTRAERLLVEIGETLPHAAEGKMIGVLVVETNHGLAFLKAFSGLWEGSATREGWVPPIGGEPPSSTASTLLRLQALKERLQALAEEDAPARLTQMREEWDASQAALEARLSDAKARRHTLRAAGHSTAALDDESRRDSRERRLFKQARENALASLTQRVASLRSEIVAVKRERRQLSRTLQAEMHAAFDQTLSADQPWSLVSLFPNGLPTGTGDCCAPKLLYHAARNGWKPLEMAEMWHGPASLNGQRQPSVFYGACENRCQPLLGPLLSRRERPLEVPYDDHHVVVGVKPSGLLTVPGREHWKQDSLLTQLQLRFPDLRTVHRLDLETSGLVVFARTAEAQAHLHRQFAARQVRKVYHAWLSGVPALNQGTIEQPLGRDPQRPGCYRVDPSGKAARTDYRLLDGGLVELVPYTGRSHQLRVHMAQGLRCPIRGDRLYGDPHTDETRLFLHATSLSFRHPATDQPMSVEAPPSWFGMA